MYKFSRSLSAALLRIQVNITIFTFDFAVDGLSVSCRLNPKIKDIKLFSYNHS